MPGNERLTIYERRHRIGVPEQIDVFTATMADGGILPIPRDGKETV
jgi:hypothetical protein